MAKVIDMSVGPHNLEGIKRITSLGVKIEEMIDQRTGKTYREIDISQLPSDGLFLIKDIRISNAYGSNRNVVKGSIKNFNKVSIGDAKGKENNVIKKNIVEGSIEDVGEFRLGDE